MKSSIDHGNNSRMRFRHWIDWPLTFILFAAISTGLVILGYPLLGKRFYLSAIVLGIVYGLITSAFSLWYLRRHSRVSLGIRSSMTIVPIVAGQCGDNWLQMYDLGLGQRLGWSMIFLFVAAVINFYIVIRDKSRYLALLGIEDSAEGNPSAKPVEQN